MSSLNVALNDHVAVHALILWGEDSTEPVDLDEGYLTLTGSKEIPVYLHAGKLYVPYGVYDTVFISDPVTLELGKTRESAVFAGYHQEICNVFAGAFNGDADRIGKNNHINSFFAGLECGLPENDARGLPLNWRLNSDFLGCYQPPDITQGSSFSITQINR